MIRAENYRDGLVICNYLSEFSDCVQTEILEDNGNALLTKNDVIGMALKCEVVRQLGRRTQAMEISKRLVASLPLFRRNQNQSIIAG